MEIFLLSGAFVLAVVLLFATDRIERALDPDRSGDTLEPDPGETAPRDDRTPDRP